LRLPPKAIKVLLVEDSRLEAEIAKRLLEDNPHFDFTVPHAETLDEAVKLLAREKVDVVLLDLFLPDSQGLDTLSRIYGLIPEIPIIALTGTDDEKVALEAMKMGAQDYLIKGQTDEIMLVRGIRWAIERKRMENSLFRSKQSFRNVVEKNQDGIMVLDRQGRVQFVNRVMETFFGRTKEAMYQEGVGLSVATGDVKELSFERPNGESGVAEMRVTDTEWNGQGAWLAVLRDITLRKNLELQLKESGNFGRSPI